MRSAAAVALRHIDSLPTSDYVVPEQTPDETVFGKGLEPDQTHIQQFGSGTTVKAADVPG